MTLKRQTGIRLDEEQAEQVEVMARKEDRSFSAMVRILVKEALEARAQRTTDGAR